MKKRAPEFKFKGKVKELMCLDSHITIHDNRAALVENCKQIIECNEVLAKIKTTNYLIEIWGKELFLNNFTNNSVEVRGTIESINLTADRKKERK